MPEAVRLVIWDLDETFWRGTISEGGVREYVQEHHDLVVELSRRGIINSICSKNDSSAALQLLREYGISEYFVFVSISWESKGSRIASIVENIGLRPETVMFIDDNPNNRAEAVSSVPGIQVEDENFLSHLLKDQRFLGKDDSSFSRLAHYKLIEKKKVDKAISKGGNEDFLRSCDVQIYIEYDVEKHIDRVIELINRTNQLNYTKVRLSEDPVEARDALRAEILPFSRQAGLVHVRDRYGDYGFVGFFVVQTFRREQVKGTANRTLRHFCFSCRTLGMLVERYVFDLLGRPDLRVVGEVLTDLQSSTSPDWIRVVSALEVDTSRKEPIASHIRMLGGCEVNALSVYLEFGCGDVQSVANYALGGLFIRMNSSPLLLSLLTTSAEEEAKEHKVFGMPISLAATDFFSVDGSGSVFIFSLALDAMTMARFVKHNSGLEVSLEINGDPAFNLGLTTPEDVEQLLSQRKHLNDQQKRRISALASYIRTDFSCETVVTEDTRQRALRLILTRTPIGARVIFLLDHDRMRKRDGSVFHAPFVSRYNSWLLEQLAGVRFVKTLCFSEVIGGDEEIQLGGNHYDRMVYYRMAGLIESTLKNLEGKSDSSICELAV